MTLPEEECAFFFAAMAQLVPALRPVFAERVASILDAYCPFCEPGPGDVDRAIRAALVGLWVPPEMWRPLVLIGVVCSVALLVLHPSVYGALPLALNAGLAWVAWSSVWTPAAA